VLLHQINHIIALWSKITVLNVKRLNWHRLATLSSIVISCGQHLSCYVWQLDLSMELRKLMSTASLSSCRRLCSDQHRTSLTSTTHSVWVTAWIMLFGHHHHFITL